MLRDWGSWDASFNAVTARVRAAADRGRQRRRHACLRADAGQRHVLGRSGGQHAGAARDGHVLVLINGAYGRRLARLTEMMGRRLSVFETADDVPTTAADVARTLDADPTITHVGLIHCETSTGILNPLPEIADVVAAARPTPDRRRDELVRRDSDRRTARFRSTR